MLNNLWQEPIEFITSKKEKINLHPIYIKDKYIYDLVHIFFTINRGQLSTKEAIKSNYLKIILFEICNCEDLRTSLELKVSSMEYTEHVYRNFIQSEFCKILSCVFKLNVEDIQILFKIKDKNKIGLSSYELKLCDVEDIMIKINDMEINESDFEKIREIILTQNGIDLEYIEQYNPNLERLKNIHYKLQNKEYANFQETVESLCCEYKRFPHEIKNELTFYTFNRIYERQSISIQYKILEPLIKSGQIELKDGAEITSWNGKIDKNGRYDDILMSQEKFNNEGLGKITKNKE